MLACSRALKQYAYSATSMQIAAATSMHMFFVFPVCAVPQQQREECTVRAPGRGQGSHQLAEDTGALQAAGAATHMHVSHPVSSLTSVTAASVCGSGGGASHSARACMVYGGWVGQLEGGAGLQGQEIAALTALHDLALVQTQQRMCGVPLCVCCLQRG